MEKLIELRKSLGFTQKQIADRLGLQHSNYCNIENGKLLYSDMEGFKDKVETAIMDEARENLIKLQERINKH